MIGSFVVGFVCGALAMVFVLLIWCCCAIAGRSDDILSGFGGEDASTARADREAEVLGAEDRGTVAGGTAQDGDHEDQRGAAGTGAEGAAPGGVPGDEGEGTIGGAL